MTRLFPLFKVLIYFQVNVWEETILKKGSQWIGKIKGAEIEVQVID